MTFQILKAPFPWFGGKSRVAPVIWERFGDVTNYVEPFAGSLAVLLGRPTTPKTETVNDLDCYLANFWRATAIDPEAVAEFADWPVNEADLHARHLWLLKQEEFREKMKTDPEFYDARVAGWWVWGLCQWIGSGWCSRLSTDRGEHRQLPSAQEMGIHRKLPHLSGEGQGVNRRLPHLRDDGNGVNRKIPNLGDDGRGINSERANYMLEYFGALRERLRRVRVCCGDWKRVTGPSVTEKHGESGVFLDPPYEQYDSYYSGTTGSCSADVRAWAIENGENPLLRIALCGYEGEHADMPASWECFRWKAVGGYGNQGDGVGRDNSYRERIWFSPYCLRPQEAFQFDEVLAL